jgi:spore coat protein U-like protein
VSPILRISGRGFYTSYGEVEATAIQSQTGSAETISQEGAIIAADGDVFFANRIDDAFAIVDAGAPGLEVSYENRPVARTDASGKAIVPTLNAYQPNKISIDPRDLPLNASIATTQELLAPPDRSGVLVDFGIVTDVRSAIVILYGANGQPLQAGLHGKTAGGRGFVVTDAITTLSPTCTNGTPYNIGLDGGLSGATDPTQRKMKKAAEFVLYWLYQNFARSLPWGNTLGMNTLTAIGTGLAQPATVYGRIAPQATPSPGTYNDTIVVTVTY